MPTTPTLIMPPALTQADIKTAGYVLGQVLRFNADVLPFQELTEAWSVRLLLDQLAAPAACVPAAHDHADVPSTVPPHQRPLNRPETQ